jgi:hypothetical protein
MNNPPKEEVGFGPYFMRMGGKICIRKELFRALFLF